MKKLTTKQQMFVTEYLKDFNATQAAVRAGYSPKTAVIIGYENLRKPYLAEKIQAELSSRRKKAKLTIEDLQEKLYKIIEAEVTNVISYNESGVSFAQHSDDIPDNERVALQSIEVIESHQGDDRMTLRTKVKFHDKLKAIELYGKTIGAFREVVEVTDTLENRLKDLWRKLDAAGRGEIRLRVAGTNQIIQIGSQKSNPHGQVIEIDRSSR